MKKSLFILFFGIGVILILLFAYRSVELKSRKKVKINNTVFYLEIADSDKLRQKGLSGRKKLSFDSGMLFTFPQKKFHYFWMKDMLIPLDFIFISDDIIVDLLENIPPPKSEEKESSLKSFTSKVPCNKVIEVNAGTIKKYNIKIQDKISELN